MSRFVSFLLGGLSRLPLSVLYVLSSCVLYPLARHVVRYRRSVVEKNLALAFPQKSEAERLAIERAFYHHLCDMLVETVYLRHISPDELRRRFCWKVEGGGLKAAEGGKATMLYFAHYGNWEWAISRLALESQQPAEGSPFTALTIYSQLHNRQANEWMAGLRSRFGMRLASISQAGQAIEALLAAGETRRLAVVAIADQLPKEQYVRHFHRFMGIKTKVLTGTEQLARRHEMQAGYCKVERTARGYYTCHIEPLPSLPTGADEQEGTPWPATDAYFDRLQQQLQQQPQYWLWSHDRWRR